MSRYKPNNMEVYLDNAATTRVDEEVLEAMLPYLREDYGNASSPHGPGRKARFAVEDARERIASNLGAEPGEIVFTSGGTEANNQALWGGTDAGRLPLVTCRTEHEAVLEPAKAIEAGGGSVALLDPGPEGVVTAEQVRDHLGPGTRDPGRGTRDVGLVSLMHTNNETGALHDIPALAAACHEAGWLLHTDAVQALGWTDLNVDSLGIDLMTISAHKIYGPKGVGALFVRSDTMEISAFVRGGSQERRRRGGTENVAAIVGFAKALDLTVEQREARRAHVESLKTSFQQKLVERLDGSMLINTPDESAPHILNISFPPVEGRVVDGEMLLLNMDVAGIRVSSGSACTSGALEPSHVLLAMGRDVATAEATIRFSIGKDNNEDEMDYAADELAKILERMA